MTYKNSKPLSLWDEALNYNEVPVYLLNATKRYKLESEINFDGNTPAIELAQPITSLNENYFVMFDVTFGDNTSHTAPCVLFRLSDNGNICKFKESELTQAELGLEIPENDVKSDTSSKQTENVLIKTK